MESLYDIPDNILENGGGKYIMDEESRVFEQFLVDYQPVLVQVEKYLEETIEKTDYVYREAYMPWKKALHELLEGAYYLARKIPLPSKEEFMEALFMFSFKGAIMFLRDICSICQLKLKIEWEKEFQDKINILLSSVSDLELKQVKVA